MTSRWVGKRLTQARCCVEGAWIAVVFTLLGLLCAVGYTYLLAVM